MKTDQNPWSSTAKDVRHHISHILTNEITGVIVTVVDVDGSAYRRPGAKMVIDEDANPTGTVTAGCLETEVQTTAKKTLRTGEPNTDIYDMTADNNKSWGLGLGCEGVITLFYEPVDRSWEAILNWLREGLSVQVASVIRSDHPEVSTEGKMAWVDGTWEDLPSRKSIPKSVLSSLNETISKLDGTGKTMTTTIAAGGDEVTLVVENMNPIDEIILFGSQNDIRPVANLGSMVGFDVTVYSPRGSTSKPEFPSADSVITGHPSEIADIVDKPKYTYPVIMSHNLVDDTIALETLIEETTVPYIGLMGPQDRFKKIRAESEVIEQADDDRISTPIGLDLGGASPVKIGVSIVSEILAVSNERDGMRLVHKEGPIHSRLEETKEK